MDSLLQELESLLHHKKSNEYYSKKLNITATEVEDLRKELKDRKKSDREIVEEILEPKWESTTTACFTKGNIEKGTLESTVTIDFEPKTIEELYNLHKVDKEQYTITNFWSKITPSGKFTSSIFCKLRLVDNDAILQKDAILDELKNFQSTLLESFNQFTKALPDKDNAECLLEISIPDIHIGKLSHRDETGEDYDIKIACERYKAAVKEILTNANLDNVSRILLPIGNDLIHVNSEDNATVAGTPQDCDSRFHKMVRAARQLLVDTITGLSAIAPVDVLIVKGNHDATTTFLLGEILDAFFTSNDRVNINNSASWRKYYQYGSNGFMYTHGDKEKHSELGLIFATEQPALWASTKHRFAKLGHLHKTRTTNYTPIDTSIGFQVQILPSLSATDEWHSGKGYIGLKQAKGFLYHPVKGEIASYTYTV